MAATRKHGKRRRQSHRRWRRRLSVILQGYNHRLHAMGRIGPNAITRVAQALREADAEGLLAAIFNDSGLSRYLLLMPTEMVPETEVVALHKAMRKYLGNENARRIGWRAGILTGHYLLENRIPCFARMILGAAPSSLSTRLLLKAIDRNAWTFCGSGEFSYRSNKPIQMTISGSPISKGVSNPGPLCDYFAATFETLFKALIDPKISVQEISCAAVEAGPCTFELQSPGAEFSRGPRRGSHLDLAVEIRDARCLAGAPAHKGE